MNTTAKLGLLLALTVSAFADNPPATPAPEPTPVATLPTPAPVPAPEKAPAPRPATLLPGLPAYAPPPPPEPKKLDQPNAAPDPDMLVLPTMTVKQKPRPRLNAEIVHAAKDHGNLLAKQKFSQLDQALNKFTLPLFGQSLAERALEEHQREKTQALTADVLNLSQALEQTDPAEAKALKEAVTRP